MSTVAATATLAVRDLTWRPHGRREPTLRGVDLDLAPGERVLLVGASGSGKSTLLHALAGLLDESLGEQTGTVRLGGARPGSRPGQVGLMLQDPSHTLVAEHVGRDAAFGPENAGLAPTLVRARAAAALRAVDFPYGADRRTTALSGGQTQRLSLAGALALEPEVLLLDEPTAMLDPVAAGTIREAVAAATDAAGLTLVVVEHQLDGWLEVCPRMVLLGRGGVVLADGPTQTVLAEHAADLAEAGVWVPRAAPPEPLELDWGPAEESPRTTPLLASHLRVTAPGTDRVLVDGLDLRLEPGEAVALLGRSGSGKSTLLRTVAGFYPTTGEVRLSGSDAAGLVRRSTRLATAVGWLPQQIDHLITRRTVLAEVLATSEALYADDPGALDAARQRAERVLRALLLWDLREADPYQVSVGEQRRMGLAAVVVHSPALLLLDEPTVGQDRHTWAAVVGVVRAHQASGGAVLASTHDPLLADALGRAVRLDAPDEPVAALEPGAYAVTEVVEPGAPPAARVNPLALLAVALGAAVGSFFVRDWWVGLLALALVLALTPLAVRRPRTVLLRLVPVGLAALTVGWSALVFSSRGAFAPEAWPVAAREVTRILYLVVPGVLLVPSLPPSRLADALAQRAHLPHRPVVVAAAALLRLQQLLDTWTRLTENRTVRGLAPGRSFGARIRHAASLTFALLVWTLRTAQQMALSMDARGFAAAHRRTFALGSPWRRRDTLVLGLAVVLALVPPTCQNLVGL